MTVDIEKIYQEFLDALATIRDPAALANLKASYLGKKGRVSELMQGLREASVEVKREVGARSNELKNRIEEKLASFGRELELQEMNARLAQSWTDISLRESVMDRGLNHGGHHPVTIVQREIEDIFLSMGFEVLDGPYIEDEFHNFEALNIPGDHPARDMQDTFWFPDGKHLLRTHTSTIQVRGMEKRRPPFKFVGPGKVFRCERTDASHEMVFHQLEGMMVQEEISVAHLTYFSQLLLSKIFKKEVEIRLRPGFFPFVEPGFEIDVKCLICKGKGCSVCKRVGWLELLPCGLVHPNVLRAGGIDPDCYQGFAFGLGLDRLVMMKYGIDDIRYLHSGDLRFISQFKAF